MPADFNKINSIPQQAPPVGAHPQMVPAPAAAPLEEKAQPEIAPKIPTDQAAVAGQSQIKTDNVKGDIATFKGNPGLISMADTFFDHAYADLQAQNDPNAYEKACLMSSQFVNECVKK